MIPTPGSRRWRHSAFLCNCSSRRWLPMREPKTFHVVELSEEDASLDEEGAVAFSLRGLLKAMIASRPESVKDVAARARIARLRERATSLRAGWTAASISIDRPDLGDLLIAGLGGESLRAAHGRGDLPFLKHLDRELARRLE